MPHEHDDELRFHPTSSRWTGIIAVVGAFAVVALTLTDPSGTPPWAAPGAALVGVLAWASILWPRLSIDGDELVLRNMLETVRVPLVAIEALVVRQFLAVWAGGKRYVSPTVGKSWHTTMRDKPGLRRTSGRPSLLRPTSDVPVGGVNYVDYIEQEINNRVDLAKQAAGGELLRDEQVGPGAGVRRQPAWLPIGLIVASVVALLISLLL